LFFYSIRFFFPGSIHFSICRTKIAVGVSLMLGRNTGGWMRGYEGEQVTNFYGRMMRNHECSRFFHAKVRDFDDLPDFPATAGKSGIQPSALCASISSFD